MIYIPQSCSKEAGCRLHTALHGCEQNFDEVGMEFVEGSGFARWADTNKFVVLFPQVSASLIENPRGCWDWWGYSGSDYLTKDAPQIAAILEHGRQIVDDCLTGIRPAAFDGDALIQISARRHS